MKKKITKFHNFYGSIKNEAMELGDKIKTLEKLSVEFRNADETNLRARARVVSSLETLQEEIESLLSALKEPRGCCGSGCGIECVNHTDLNEKQAYYQYCKDWELNNLKN